MRPILHSVLAMKMGKSSVESYTEHMKHTQPKSHDSEMLQRDKCEKCGSDMQSSFFVASSLGEYRQISDNLGIVQQDFCP